MTARGVISGTLRGLAVLLLILVLAIAAIYLWLRTSLPQVSGTLALPGLTAEAKVTRDAAGIPRIVAANAHDAAFALGFVHAQDRIFQMDLERRYGAGRLSELAGKSMLARDRFMRTLGLYQAAERQLANLSAPVRQTLEAYAAGVNAYIAHHSGAQHPYYYFVPGPEPWRPVDSLVIGKIMSLYLAQNFRDELQHARLAAVVTPERLDELYPPYPQDGFVTLARLAAIYRQLPLDQLAAAVPPWLGQRNASNNWVLDGRHTVTGKPILENDPHLVYSAPPIWYLARIETPGFSLTGGTIPGLPFLIVGHNGHVGWGFTETGGDVEDLFIEKVDPDNPDHYLAPQGSLPFKTRRETIHVKGAPDVTITVRSTRHGPVISDVSAAAAAATASKSGYVLALEATFLQDGDKTPQALWSMNRARDWSAFDKALADYGAPQMNIVYGDTGGTIAFTAPARIPIRKKGKGWLPVPGWTGEYDWTGYIPFDKLPRSVDPPNGRFVSANNKIVPDSYPYFLSRDWVQPYRADRIVQLLDATPKQSLDSTAAIAADTLSLAAKRLLPLMLRAPPADERSAAAMDRLRAWDGRMDRDKTAPLLFVAWLRALNRQLFAGKLGNSFQAYWKLRPLVIGDVLTHETGWCDRHATAGPQSCAAALSQSLRQALDGLSKRFGGDMASWRWGAAHEAYFRNPVLSRVPLLGSLFALRIPASGGSYTVNTGDIQAADDAHPYTDVLGPGLRMILDFSDLAASRFMIAPGMSGNPLSLHYGNLMVPWRELEWIAIARSPGVDTLTLVPG